MHLAQGVPQGYWFVGSLEVYAADENCCPTGSPLATMTPIFPHAGWNHYSWSDLRVPSRFVVTYRQVGPSIGSPIQFTSDRPTAENAHGRRPRRSPFESR